MKKYELTNETKVFHGVRLHRIRALRDFDDVHAGDLGGWVKKESNLSHDGLCWIYDDACVCGDACVCDDAIVCGNAYVCDNAIIFGNAYVCDDATVYGNAYVYGDACVGSKARVFGDACVCDNARVYGSACVCGNACVFGDALIANTNEYLSIPNIGGRGDTTTFFKCKDGVIRVKCGCFYGSIDEFLQAVNKEHGDNKFGQIYRLAIEMARIQIAV